MAVEDEDATTDVVIVELGRVRFAFPAASVLEVLPLFEPTPMPDWPEHALGVLELRGRLMPLIDPSPLLGLVAAPLQVTQCILEMEVDGHLLGVLVDRVEAVTRVALRDAASLDAAVLKPSALCLGLFSWHDAPILLLDPRPLLATLHASVQPAAAALPGT